MKNERIQKENSMKNRIKKTFFLLLCMAGIITIAAVSLTGTSIYYYQDFTTQAGALSAGWTNMGYATSNDLYRISREGLYFPSETSSWAGPNQPSVIIVTNQKLLMYGRPINGDSAYNALWTGKATQFIPKNSTLGANASASATEPFGFMIIRDYAHLDNNEDNNFGTEDRTIISTINIWLAQEDLTVVNELDNLPNFVYFMEQATGHWNGNRYDDPSRLGYFDGDEHYPTSAYGPTNREYNRFATSDWRYVYDDSSWDTVATAQGRNNTLLNGYSGYPVNPNTKTLAIRITHDGSKVRFYLNPNPYDTLNNTTHPNEFMFFGETAVNWNTDMKVMIGHENFHWATEDTVARYDDFIIRSVCNTLKAEITPKKVLRNNDTTFKVAITPTFSANDSGIGEIIIRKPAYMTNAWQLNTVTVTNGRSGSYAALTRVTTGLPTATQFRSMTNMYGDLKVLFHTDTTDAASVIDNATVNKDITVAFTLKTPETANAGGVNFEVFANLEKYDGWTYDILNLPTTGKKKGTDKTVGSMLVKSYNSPYAYAGVSSSPGAITEGANVEASIVYEISTKDVVGSPDISQAIIAMPLAFSPSNVQSLVLNNDTASISITNDGVSNYVVLNYSSDMAGLLPSPNGYDQITFSTFGTPDLPDGETNARYYFSSQVSGEAFVDGATLEYTGTNSLYPTQGVLVTAENPVLECSIFPNKLANAVKTNNMTYTVKNSGGTYNTVARLRILIDVATFEDPTVLNSSVGGNISFVTPYIIVDYAGVGTNLVPGQTDSITFQSVHKITDINNPETQINFNSDGDNNNGKGYVGNSEATPNAWRVSILPPTPTGQYYITPEKIYTTVVTNEFSFYILNNGPRGDKIYQALIAIPADFTNFSGLSVSSSLIVNSSDIVLTSLNSTNYIWLKYYSANTNIVSLNEVEGVTPYDKVTVLLGNNVYTTNRYNFPVFVDNRSNESLIGNFTSTNAATAFSTNQIYADMVYPPIKAAFDVESRFTNTYGATPVNEYLRIDATTVTNTIVVRIKNNGLYGNDIKSIKIALPTGVYSNIVTDSVSSEFAGTAGYSNIPASGGDPAYISYNYVSASTNIGSGMTDTITFKMIDNAVGNAVASFQLLASNDAETDASVTTLLSGSGGLEIFIPPARGAGSVLSRVFYTTPAGAESNSFVFTISNYGGGSNGITKGEIILPAIFNNAVTAVSNTHLGVGDSDPQITISADKVTIDYSSDVLAPGRVDKVYLKVDVNYNNQALDSVDWDLKVDNSGTTANDTIVVTGGSKTQYSTVRSIFNVYETGMDDNDVFTSNTTNLIKIRLVNGTNANNQTNMRFRILVPEPFNMPYISAVDEKSATITSEGRYVVVDVSSADGIDGYGADIVTLQVSDNFSEAETNTVWNVDVDYGDGLWKPAESNTKISTVNYTNVLSIVLPPATALAFLVPEFLYVDKTVETYTLSITNNGITGNHIRLLTVAPPVFITNIDSVVNTGPGFNSWFDSSDNLLYIHYTNERLEVGSGDTISFSGYDEAVTSSGSAEAWTVKVANISNTNSLNAATVPFGNTLSTEVIFPTFRAEYQVSPSTVSTAVSSNVFTLFVENRSPQSGLEDSYITSSRIKIPENIFITNSAYLATTVGSSIVISNDYIVITYPGDGIAPKDNDQVTIGFSDTLAAGETNVDWNVQIIFSTLGQNYTNAVLAANQTNRLDFVMPVPTAVVKLLENDIYTTTGRASLVYSVSNSGSGSNLLKEVRIGVPAAYVSSVHTITSGLAESVNLVGNEIVAVYTNFTVATVDQIGFVLTNTEISTTNFDFTTVLSNSTYTNDASTLGLDTTLNVVTPPTTRLEPAMLYTTDVTNVVKLYVNNNGSGDSSIMKFKVEIPAIFNDIISVESSFGGTISTVGQISTVSYSGSGIIAGGSDILTFTLVDSIAHGTSNVSWLTYADNGVGYAATVNESAGANDTAFNMPSPAGAGWVLPIWLYASETTADFVTNTMSVVVSNAGSGSNNIYGAMIEMPINFTNIQTVVSSKGGVCSFTDNTAGTNILYVSYTNALLTPGEADNISFKLKHNVNNEGSYSYVISVDNDNGSSYQTITVADTDTQQQRVDIFIKEEAPQLYISSAKAPYIWETMTTREIYTMDNTAVINFAVKNLSKRFTIDGLNIDFTNMYTVTAITSTIAGGIPATDYLQVDNTLLVNYGANSIGSQSYDTLSVYVSYVRATASAYITANGPITNTMNGSVRFTGSSEYLPTTDESKGELVLNNATFGRFKGLVFPFDSGSTVTLKLTGSDSMATNIEGETFNASISTNSGVYIIDKIPAGFDYSVIVLPPLTESTTNSSGEVVSPVSFKQFTLSNQPAALNTVSTIANVTLLYDKLNYLAVGEQQVFCPTDGISHLLVPPDSLFSGVGVNISIEDFSANNITATLNNPQIENPLSGIDLDLFHFELTDSTNGEIAENGMKGDVSLVLHYDEAAMLTQGWDEADLAIYYWKSSTGQWVMVGGTVDVTADTVSANVSYLHSYYAVMGKDNIKTVAIKNVKASPNPFTPGRGGAEFSNLKLTFSFDQAYAKYEVKIYDLKGRLVQKFTKDGSYAQGEVFWDGKDVNGFNIAGGVYLYQIHAGLNVFTGSVLVLK